MTESKNRTIHRILDIEVDMFLRVPTGEEPSCRSHMEDMKLHRRGQFSTWSEETCESYLNDLREAERKGVNLMTVKYARMDNLIPPYSDNPLIQPITDQFKVWQQDMLRDYPNVMRGARDIEGFSNYLKGELETCSGQTLKLLYKDVEGFAARGKNMSVAVYGYLAKQSGYDSLEAMEQALAC
ncbi:MAG: DUF4125 family protein [Spirochaetia bacterium]|nr:DUF4125 family protein [Spirochaetia bacterium]